MRIKPTRADAYALMLDGAVALASVEAAGIAVDEGYLASAMRRTEKKIGLMEEGLKADEVYRLWKREYGTRANLGSREQLAHVLFDVMGVPSSGYTAASEFEDKKRYRTDKMVFTDIDHPFCRDYEECRKYKQLLGTFLKGLRRETVGGFVHPMLALNLVETGRSSSQLVNIQNQWNRDPVMSVILRKCYVPRKPDWVLVEVDYGAVEVRGIAVATKDPELMRRLEDPHREWACEILFLKPGQVDKKTHRDWGKNRFVFPKFYGSTFRKIAPHVWQEAAKPEHKAPGDPTRSLRDHLADHGVHELGDPKDPRPGTFADHVRSVEAKFDRLFAVAAACRREWYEDYKRRGYFDHLTGYRQEGVYSYNDILNHRIQGMCFHWLLWSLIRIQREFRRRGMEALIVSEIHDCLLIDCPESELRDVLTICKRVMTEDIREHWKWICVPLIVEADVTPRRDRGGNWALKTPWVEKNGTWVPKKAA